MNDDFWTAVAVVLAPWFVAGAVLAVFSQPVSILIYVAGSVLGAALFELWERRS